MGFGAEPSAARGGRPALRAAWVGVEELLTGRGPAVREGDADVRSGSRSEGVLHESVDLKDGRDEPPQVRPAPFRAERGRVLRVDRPVHEDAIRPRGQPKLTRHGRLGRVPGPLEGLAALGRRSQVPAQPVASPRAGGSLLVVDREVLGAVAGDAVPPCGVERWRSADPAPGDPRPRSDRAPGRGSGGAHRRATTQCSRSRCAPTKCRNVPRSTGASAWKRSATEAPRLTASSVSWRRGGVVAIGITPEHGCDLAVGPRPVAEEHPERNQHAHGDHDARDGPAMLEEPLQSPGWIQRPACGCRAVSHAIAPASRRGPRGA